MNLIQFSQVWSQLLDSPAAMTPPVQVAVDAGEFQLINFKELGRETQMVYYAQYDLDDSHKTTGLVFCFQKLIQLFQIQEFKDESIEYSSVRFG